MTEPWRHACPDCGSVVLSPRTERGGYRCEGCYAVVSAHERVDKKAVADGGERPTPGDARPEGALLAELAGEGRVAIDPHPQRGMIPPGHSGALGTYDGRELRVYGTPFSATKEGWDFTRIWRVATEPGTFDVAYSVDRTPGNRTHTVVVTRVGGEDGGT